jgi:hypothetical protein
MENLGQEWLFCCLIDSPDALHSNPVSPACLKQHGHVEGPPSLSGRSFL